MIVTPTPLESSLLGKITLIGFKMVENGLQMTPISKIRIILLHESILKQSTQT